MTDSKIILATTTFYRSLEELRFNLACQSVREAMAYKYKIVIVDGSPIPAIGDGLSELGAKVFQQEGTGMGSARRQAFAEAIKIAGDDDIIVWFEPEKIDLVRWLKMIGRPIRNGDADIIVPIRTEESWATYPWPQRGTESIGIETFNQLVMRPADLPDVDIFFGPIAWSVKAAEYLRDFDPAKHKVADTYVQQFAVIVAIQNGARVGSVEVNFVYPKEQTEEEETWEKFPEMLEKRCLQIRDITNAFIKMAT